MFFSAKLCIVKLILSQVKIKTGYSSLFNSLTSLINVSSKIRKIYIVQKIIQKDELKFELTLHQSLTSNFLWLKKFTTFNEQMNHVTVKNICNVHELLLYIRSLQLTL